MWVQGVKFGDPKGRRVTKLQETRFGGPYQLPGTDGRRVTEFQEKKRKKSQKLKGEKEVAKSNANTNLSTEISLEGERLMRERLLKVFDTFRAYVRMDIRVYTDRVLTGLIHIIPPVCVSVCVGVASSHAHRDVE